MARRRSIVDHIAVVPMFYACSRRELQAVSRLATELDVPAGKVLIQEGKPGQEFMIVLEGTAVATRGRKKLATFGPGDYFGEIALLDPGLRTATVVAETPMSLAVVGQREFGDILEQVPALANKIMRGLARRLREVDRIDVL
ncbi:MAG TPA: cyclic nucleotide-binding domain-containing protein [Jatrophihabitantaceae bacterium]|jgi:CRP-like cAMP-binding protein|nr:cyclic nucleotide-binding domain-containing protein [Jatrophihabitantaceae bacterium]